MLSILAHALQCIIESMCWTSIFLTDFGANQLWMTLAQKNWLQIPPCYSPYSLCTFTYSSLGRCSVYLLYCCQSTNTDTWGASAQHYTYSRYPRSTRLNNILLNQHRPRHIATQSITLRSWSHLPLRTDSDSIEEVCCFSTFWQLFSKGSWVLWRRCCVGRAI